MIGNLLSQKAKSIEPYVPGEQPRDKKYIKLNTNENPYQPSPKVIEAIKNSVNGDLRLYPDPDSRELCSTIARYYHVNPDQIFVGNGSDEILAFSFMAFFNPDKPILFPDITYSFYPVYSKLFNIDFKEIKLNDIFEIPIKDFFVNNGGIIFPNPNAPTSQYLSIKKIKEILKMNPNVVVIVDEAYIDFGGESAIKLINEYPNLLVIQTFSKSRSLAGLRIGFAIGQKELVEGINKIKNSINSYTLDRLAVSGAIAAIKDEKYFKETVQKIIRTREKTFIQLKDMGFNVFESKANFLFISHPTISAKLLFEELRQRGILVRYFNKPRIDNYLRISIGTDEEMNQFRRVLEQIILEVSNEKNSKY